MTLRVSGVVLPSEEILRSYDLSSLDVTVGPGLRLRGNSVVAARAGLLEQRDGGVFHVNSAETRYCPTVGDPVVGLIAARAQDSYVVDVNGHRSATLSHLAFEGATKRFKPDAQVGDALYCRVAMATADAEPEVQCVDAAGKANGLGILPSGCGFIGQFKLAFCRALLAPECSLLRQIGRDLPFEIAVGLNGRIWLNAPSAQSIILLYNYLLHVQNTPFDNQHVTFEQFCLNRH